MSEALNVMRISTHVSHFILIFVHKLIVSVGTAIK